MQRLIAFLLALLVATTPAGAVDINGELKKALLEKQSSDPTGTEARIYYNTTSKKAKVYNGTAWGELGGSGSGEKNYITGTSTATGWTCVGDLDVATSTTAAELPRENTTASGIKITADANTQSTSDYCYHDFTLDDVDLSKKLSLKWAQKTTGSYNASDLAVIVTTQADRTTALHTPTTTNIPAADLVLSPNDFDTATTTTLSLVIRATTDMTTNAGIVISDVIVSPDKVAVPGFAGEPWTTFTPSYSNGPTMSASQGRYRRMGDSMEVEVTFTASVAGAANNMSLTLPDSKTADTTKITSTGGTAVVTLGNAWWLDSGTKVLPLNVVYNSSTNVVFYKGDSSSDYIDGDEFANTDQFSARFTVPIAEWAGSGTVSVDASSGCTYLYSTDTATAAGDSDASPDYAYGPGGANFVSIDSTTDNSVTTKFVYALRDIQATDIVQIETNRGTNNTWLPVSQSNLAYSRQSNRIYGMRLNSTASDARQLQVIFGNAGTQSGATYATSGTAWSNVTSQKWRVAHCYGLNARGFARATQSSLGLVKAGQVPGTNTNDDAEAGNVGEAFHQSLATASANALATNVTENIQGSSITLTAGDWMVSGAVAYLLSAATVTDVDFGISSTSATLPASTRLANPTSGEYGHTDYIGVTTTSLRKQFAIPSYRVTVASGATLPLYLVARATFSAGTVSVSGYYTARRIR